MDTGAKKSNKVWIIVGIIGGLCILGVVVAIIGLSMAGNFLKKSISFDPSSAAKSAHEIADYDLPPGYSEITSMNILGYRMVMIGPANQAPGPLFMLAQFAASSAVNQEQMVEQFKQAVQQQTNQSYTSMKVVETRPMTIRGEDTEVVISEGTLQSGQTMRQLITTFPGKNGQAMLMVQENVTDWDEDLIYGFIGSLR